MDIGWAVAALRRGEKVRRPHWALMADAYREAGGWAWVYLYLEKRDGHEVCVMVRHSNGQASGFVMIDPHLLAEDWEIAG